MRKIKQQVTDILSLTKSKKPDDNESIYLFDFLKNLMGRDCRINFPLLTMLLNELSIGDARNSQFRPFFWVVAFAQIPCPKANPQPLKISLDYFRDAKMSYVKPVYSQFRLENNTIYLQPVPSLYSPYLFDYRLTAENLIFQLGLAICHFIYGEELSKNFPSEFIASILKHQFFKRTSQSGIAITVSMNEALQKFLKDCQIFLEDFLKKIYIAKIFPWIVDLNPQQNFLWCTDDEEFDFFNRFSQAKNTWVAALQSENIKYFRQLMFFNPDLTDFPWAQLSACMPHSTFKTEISCLFLQARAFHVREIEPQPSAPPADADLSIDSSASLRFFPVQQDIQKPSFMPAYNPDFIKSLTGPIKEPEPIAKPFAMS